MEEREFISRLETLVEELEALARSVAVDHEEPLQPVAVVLQLPAERQPAHS
jgi:hypothetical protein